MPPSPPKQSLESAGPNYFATTHWSVVLTAGQSRAPGAAEALEKLCRAYWRPLYAYVRRRSYNPHDAQDLTQEFFSRFLEKNYLKSVARERGKFRSFLLASMNHFLANEWDKAKAHKRGGRVQFISIEWTAEDPLHRLDVSTDISPEKIYERQWALTLLDLVLNCLRDEFAAAGKSDFFERLKLYLTGDKGAMTYLELAAELQTTVGAIKTAVHRMRRRYRELLHDEVAQTVASEREVEEELRALLAALN